jgi:hypothetical protein
MSINEDNLKLKYKRMLGLFDVDNTSDENKPLSLAARDELAKKLGLSGGTLTGGLTGTTGIFSNNVISNTSGYTGGISMLSLYTQLNSLSSQISALNGNIIYISQSSIFPIKIPYSYDTIDQISNSNGDTGSTRSSYYKCNNLYISEAMTSMNSSFGFFGAWGIKRSVVNRNVWMNDWTFVTKLWFNSKLTIGSPNICDKIVVKFGEDWDRWDNGSEGIINRGDEVTTGIASSDPNKNKYIIINNPTSTDSSSVTVSNMATPNPNNPTTIALFWTLFPHLTLSSSKGGVYIVISYNTTTVPSPTIKIDFCLSNSLTTDVNSYISSTAFYDFRTNDTRPFHIYVNGGIPYWYFGMVLFNTSNDTLTNYIKRYKTQFSIIY